MSKFIKFKDAVNCTISLPKKSYHLTKDSKSKSGHKLVTQIDMTHSGIVTGNYGFYLPEMMKKGVPSFTDNYKKPVILGHDDDSDPVGRVAFAEYIDTSKELRMNDRYLSTMFDFMDKKSKKVGVHDFAQYVVQEYWGKDNYKGLGHIRGTLEITDPNTIDKILDERYLTVSTAMMSDQARCSECGQDWINEGLCEHERGKIYDSGVPVMVIPGSQTYRHLGIVTEPADPFAAGFSTVEIINDGVSKELERIQKSSFTDKFSIAASLFSYHDNKLFSLSDEKETDLIEVKNDIQQIQDSLNRTENAMIKITKDQIEATISLWQTGEEGDFSSVRVSKYVKELDAESLAELAKKAMASLDSQEFKSEAEFTDALANFVEKEVPAEVTTKVEDSTEEQIVSMKKVKVLDSKFRLVDGSEYEAKLEDEALEEIKKLNDSELTKKDLKEISSLIVKSRNEDAIALLSLDSKDKELSEIVAQYKETKDKKFKLASLSEEQVVERMNEFLSDDLRITEEEFTAIEAKDCAGSGKYFPVTKSAHAVAAKKVLGLAQSSDSLKGKILGNIEKIASKIEDSVQIDEETFDTSSTECNNQLELTDEKILEDLASLLSLADERDILGTILDSYLTEKEQEIKILEEQLDAANDEIEKLENEIKDFQDLAKKDLAKQVVDAKIESGFFGIEKREEEILSHLERSEDSLRDMYKDLSGLKKVVIEEEKSTIATLVKVENPVIQDSSESATEQLEESKINIIDKNELRKNKIVNKYNQLKSNKGKAFADSWLNKQNF